MLIRGLMGIPASGDKKNIVKLAYLYFQEGRWDNAVEEYKKLLELDPEDFNIHNMLGDVYVKKNAAMEAYEEYCKVTADLINRGQVDKATLINKKIARLDSSQLTPEALQKQNLIKLHIKAEEALQENKVEEAVEIFSEILKLDSEDLIVAAKLAELEEKTGRIPDAVQQYIRIGESFLNSHLFKKAMEMFKKVVVMDPQNTAAHLQLAKIYIKQGSENDAKKEYLNVSESALAKDDLDNAFEYAGKAVELKSIEAHYIVGIVLFKRQKWAEAKVEFDILLRFKLNHVGAQVYLGKVYAAMDQSDKAVEAFQKALKTDKDNVAALEAWAEYCIKKKNNGEAIQTLSTLIDKAVAGNEMARAVELARNMVAVDENLGPSKLKLAQVLEKNGDRNGSADVYYQLSLICDKQNKPQDAAQYVRKTLEMNPANQKALAMAPERMKPFGDMMESAVHPMSALPGEFSENIVSKVNVPEQPKVQAVAVNPQEAFKAQLAVADQYVKQGLLDEAIDIYQQLSEAHPENLEIKKKLNGVYTAYAKTGTDLTSVLEADAKAEMETQETAKKTDEAVKKDLKDMEIKAREDADKKVRGELEKRAREEAEKKVHEEVEKRSREEAEKKSRVEAEKKVREEMELKIRAEMEKKVREEAEKKAHGETEKKVREEMELKIRAEVEKKVREEMEKKPKTPSSTVKTEKEPAVGGLDDMIAIAEADLLHNQGRNEDAATLYRAILERHPNNPEVLKKMAVIDDALKLRVNPVTSPKATPVLKVVESPTGSTTPTPPVDPEKDSNSKKKSNKIGYV